MFVGWNVVRDRAARTRRAPCIVGGPPRTS